MLSISNYLQYWIDSTKHTYRPSIHTGYGQGIFGQVFFPFANPTSIFTKRVNKLHGEETAWLYLEDVPHRHSYFLSAPPGLTNCPPFFSFISNPWMFYIFPPIILFLLLLITSLNFIYLDPFIPLFFDLLLILLLVWISCYGYASWWSM